MTRRASERKNLSDSQSATQLFAVLNSPSVSSISPSPEPQRPAANMVGKKNNMRRTSPKTDVPLPVTYTPTTHRISKAKKGKRVHACEFPGCNKVFTRAEHRRRHELNHNPEASYPCKQPGCKKAFHRPDLLARHMERHDLESQNEQSMQWGRPASAPVVTDSSASIPRCVSADASTTPLLAPTPQSNSMSIGSIVAPGIHPDLANEDVLMWSSIEAPLQAHAQPMFQSHIPQSADSPFYSSPAETCPSPLSESACSLAPHSSSSISSGSVSVIDQFPKSMLKHDIISSPLQMATPLHWDGSDAGLPPSQLVSISLGEDLMPCQYPSPAWSSSDCLPYDDQPLDHFQTVGWKAWTL